MAEPIRRSLMPALPPVDGLEVVMEKICHKEQIGIWANEITSALALSDFLREEWTFDDSVDLEREIAAQLLDVIKSAFTHPGLDLVASLSQASSVIAGLRSERITAERDALEAYRKLQAAEARIAELEAAIDSAEIAGGLTENGNLWRFWSQKAQETAGKAEARISSLEEEIKRLREERDEARRGEYAANEHEPTWDEITSVWKARAETAEQEAKALLDALNQVGLTPEQKSWVESFLKTRAFLAARQALEDHNG